MTNHQPSACTRRTFLQATSAGVSLLAASHSQSLTAAERARSPGANDRIRIGVIGCGDRAVGALMPGIHKHDAAQNAEFVAVCDPWRVARENAAALLKQWYGTDARQCARYRDLLEMKDLDAVIIASCDHQHATHLEAAARAGKHIYIEKPMAKNMAELRRACDVVQAAGVVVQVGTNTRSTPQTFGCRELYKSGLLGKASRIEQCRNGEKPYWYGYLKDVRKEDIDWDEFLMDAPKRPFDPGVYSGWYGYREFSDGPIPGLASHFIDLLHFVTGAKFPRSCVCLGGTFTWKEEHQFTCPDQVEALWSYPEGFLAAYSTDFGNGDGSRIRFACEKGNLNMQHLWTPATCNAVGGPKRDGGIRGETPVKPVDCPDHWLDWLQCMRSGKAPVAPIEAGYQHAVACIMAMQSFDSGRRTIYDHEKREIREG
jgi:predicted dehydrogenase